MYNISNNKGECTFTNVPKGAWQLIAYKNNRYTNFSIILNSDSTIVAFLNSKTISTQEVIIQAKKEVLNSNQGVFTLDIEKTKQYPASMDDPNRLISNSPSTTITDDNYNFIVVRGNTPTSLIYKVNGIEVPAPNHFATFGSTGGSLSMFKTDAISSLSLYTSAFSAEHGNALAGIFDLKLKDGNKDKRKLKIQVGVVGLGLNSDGPILKNNKHSYLVSYRYSSLGLLKAIDIQFDNTPLPTYQDFQYNINLQSKFWSMIKIWSLFGYNTTVKKESYVKTTTNYMFLQGINLCKNINCKLTLNIDALFATNTSKINEKYKTENNVNIGYNENVFREQLTLTYQKNEKFNTSFGFIHSLKNYKYGLNSVFINSKYIENTSDEVNVFQFYNNYNISLFKQFNTEFGVQSIYTTVINRISIDPRLKLKYNLNEKVEIGLSSGFYTKLEPIYIYNDQNKGLGYSKSKSINLGFNFKLTKSSNFKTEVYYEYLYQIPIGVYGTGISSNSSYINIYSVSTGDTQLENNASGYNKGVEFLFEKYIDNEYFVMLNSSFFESKYRENDSDMWRNSRFNLRYNLNLVLGKTIQLNNKSKLGISGRVSANGGQYFEAVNLVDSKKYYRTKYEKDLTQRAAPYSKIDFQLSYLHNYEKCSIEYKLDIMNVLNTKNMLNQYYDIETGTIKNTYMLGLVPLLNINAMF